MNGPFGGDPLDWGTQWLAYFGVGDGKSIGKPVELGVQSDVTIDGSNNYATIVTIHGPANAAFAALNSAGRPDQLAELPGVGIFGQSIAGGIDENDYKNRNPDHKPRPDPLPQTAGIGVAGHCNTGCGVYGQSIFGVGVVGYAATNEVWPQQQFSGHEETFQNSGVLGVSEFGPGIRGHGGDDGVLVDPTGGVWTTAAAENTKPGGVFSSGTLARRTSLVSQLFSMTPQPQVSLVPFDGAGSGRFPQNGSVGDFFVAFDRETVDEQHASLFVCLEIIMGIPKWKRVALDPPTFSGGDSIPPPGA